VPWGNGHGDRLDKSGWQRQADSRRILARDGRRCQLRLPGVCTVTATEVDHRIPLIVTGPAGDVDSNKQAACAPCHRAKTARERAAGQARKSRRRPTEAHPGLIVARRGGG
jgi:5-methylcytosine-specific restriction endonuclease McrA